MKPTSARRLCSCGVVSDLVVWSQNRAQMVTYPSAHLPSHPHTENRSPNDDDGAMSISCTSFFLCSTCACCDTFEICMMCFSFRARAGRLSFVISFFPYIDLASHVLVVSVLCIFKNLIPAKGPLKTKRTPQNIVTGTIAVISCPCTPQP